MDLLATLLVKTSFSLEDKIILENSISILMGTILFKNELFANFLAFQKEDGAIRNTEQIVLAGLLCQEEKIRLDLSRALGVLSIHCCRDPHNALYFLLGVLARNFGNIQNRPSHQFFELFNKLIDQKAIRDEVLGDRADDSSAIYNPEELLNQIIDKIKTQQKQKVAEASQGDASAEDELEAQEIAEQ